MVDQSPHSIRKPSSSIESMIFNLTNASCSFLIWFDPSCLYLFHPAPKTEPSDVRTTVWRVPAKTSIALYWLSMASLAAASHFGKSSRTGDGKTVALFCISFKHCSPPSRFVSISLYRGKPSCPLTFQPQTYRSLNAEIATLCHPPAAISII